jgi:hypothetical protein
MENEDGDLADWSLRDYAIQDFRKPQIRTGTVHKPKLEKPPTEIVAPKLPIESQPPKTRNPSNNEPLAATLEDFIEEMQKEREVMAQVKTETATHLPLRLPKPSEFLPELKSPEPIQSTGRLNGEQILEENCSDLGANYSELLDTQSKKEFAKLELLIKGYKSSEQGR